MFNLDFRRGLFKDKKLDKLWHKAQKSGLTEEELLVLKSEFLHHQVCPFAVDLQRKALGTYSGDPNTRPTQMVKVCPILLKSGQK